MIITYNEWTLTIEFTPKVKDISKIAAEVANNHTTGEIASKGVWRLILENTKVTPEFMIKIAKFIRQGHIRGRLRYREG